MTIESRIQLLRSQLKVANEQIDKANRSIERAHAKLEKAHDVAYSIQFEIDQELISSWGATPDWKVLLDDPDDHTSVMHEYTNSLLNKIGMWASGKHVETNQRCLGFSMATLSNTETQFYFEAINTTLPFITPSNGNKSYNLGNVKEGDCAFSLTISNDVFYVKKMSWGSVIEKNEFTTLWAALRFIQENVCDTAISPDENAIEHQP
jgi:hypothetical protein